MVRFAVAPDRAALRARENDLAFVAVLAEAERSGLGWERRGVRGWLSVAEIGSIVDRKLTDCGPRMVDRGLVQSVALSEFGFHRRLYRVTEPGSAWVDRLLGRGHRSLAPAATAAARDASCCPVKLQAWSAVLGLRWAMATVQLSRHRDAGWFLLREVRDALPVEGRPVPFSTLELQWLRDRGMVEQRRQLASARPLNPASYWRLSGLGACLYVTADHHWPNTRGWSDRWLDAQVLPAPAEFDVASEIASNHARLVAPAPSLLLGQPVLVELISSRFPVPSHGDEQ